MGDLRVTNPSAFGAVGDDYVVTGVRGDNLPLARMPVPTVYDRFRYAQLPSSVLELAELYATHADDVAKGTYTTPTFQDALRMHRLLEAATLSTGTGGRIAL